MTANELRDMLIAFCAHNGGRNGECVIAVPTGNESVGPSACSNVKHAAQGIDWDKGKFFLITEDTLVVERPLPMHPDKLATQRLDQIRDAHGKCGFEYIKKSHSWAWCEGYKAGVAEHYTGPAKEESSGE